MGKASSRFVNYDLYARYPAGDRNRIRDLMLRGNAVGVAMEYHGVDVGELANKSGVAAEVMISIQR